MVKKKNKHIFLWIFGLIVLLIVMNWFGLLDKLNGNLLVITPINEFPIDAGGDTYQCSESLCKVQGITFCTNPGTSAKVIWRNALDGGWVAWDWDGNGALECFQRDLTITNPPQFCKDAVSLSILVTKGVLGGKAFYHSSAGAFTTTSLCTKSRQDVYYSKESSYCNTAVTPQLGFEDNEMTSGSQSLYNCPGSFEIKKPDGTLYFSEPNFNYQSNSAPGNKTSSIQSIYYGWTASLKGGNSRKLFYGTYKESEDCATGGRGKCLPPDSSGNSNGYYNCENGVLNKNSITYCQTDNGLYCQEGACVVPFQTKEIHIVDSTGIEKTGFTNTESIKVNVKLQAKAGTPIYGKIGKVYLDFYKVGSQTSKTNAIKDNFDFNNPGSVSIPIDNPGLDGDFGLYYLKVRAEYDPSKPAIVIGLDNPSTPTYQISIGSEVSCTIQLQTSITDVMTSKLLTNVPILVKLNTRVSNTGQPITTKNVKVYVNKGTSQETLTNLVAPASEGSSGDAYTYVYNYQTDKPGSIYTEADVSYLGVPAKCTITSTIEDMKITTRFYNTGGNCLPTGPHTFYFETVDTLNRPADTTNTLCVKKPGSGTLCEPINNLIQSVSGGKIGQYQFTYDLVKNVGETAQFTFLLTTHSNTYNRDYVVPDLSIEVKDNCVPSECITTGDCIKKGASYICVNGSCVNPNPNWWLYIGMGVGAIVLVIAGYFIIRYFGKPKQDVYTGLEGL